MMNNTDNMATPTDTSTMRGTDTSATSGSSTTTTTDSTQK
jgi:hypothetical protein